MKSIILRARPSFLQVLLQNDAQDQSFRLVTGANAFVLIGMVTLAIWAAWLRGPWLDEFWTLWLSQHDLPLAETLRDRWLIDVHPPFFVGLNWLAQPLIGDSILIRRLANFVPLSMTLLFAAAICKRYYRNRNFTTVFVIMALTSPIAAYNITEIRSYFTQICGMMSLIVCLHSMLMLEEGQRVQDNRLLALAACALIFLCLNLHYVTAVVATSIVATSGLGLLVRRHKDWFWLLLAAGVFASMPLVAWFVSQNAFLQQVSGTFWLIVSLPVAIKTLIVLIGKSFCLNFVIVAALFISVVGYFNTRSRQRSSTNYGGGSLDPSTSPPDQKVFIAAMAFGFVTASLMLLLVNAHHPQIFAARYLSSVAVTTVAIVAAIIAELVCRRRRIFSLFLLNGALIYGGAVISHGLDEGWDGAASFIRSQIKECGSLQVLATVYRADYVVPNQEKVLDWAYREEAARFGFPIKVLPIGSKLDLSDGGNCQTALWIDHVIWSELPKVVTAEDIEKKLDVEIPPIVLRSARLFFSGSGIVILMGPTSKDM